MARKLYVGNLTYEVTDGDLSKMFEAHGTVESAQIIMDRDTGRSTKIKSRVSRGQLVRAFLGGRTHAPYSLSDMAADGIDYLQPEIVTWMKAHRANAKDERDLALILPRLSPSQREWLGTTLEQTHPGHRWLKLLDR